MSSAWQLPYTTLYFMPTAKKCKIFVRQNYLNSTAHSRTYAIMHTEGGMYFI